MPDTPVDDIGKVTPKSNYMSFRQKEIAFRIPFDVRSLAPVLTVDVSIISYVHNPYFNLEVLPDESFYGTATLVAQGIPWQKIPLRWGNNRVLQWIDNAVLLQWRQHQSFYQSRRDMLATALEVKGYSQVDLSYQALLVAILNATLPVVTSKGHPPAMQWEPCPVSEVLIECWEKTQVGVEVNWYEMVPYTKDGYVISPKARDQNSRDNVDGRKDKPQKQNASDPYSGNDPTTPPSGGWVSGNIGGGANGDGSRINGGGGNGGFGLIPIPYDRPISIGSDGKPVIRDIVNPPPDLYVDGSPIIDFGDGTGTWRGRPAYKNPDGSWTIQRPVDLNSPPSQVPSGQGWRLTFYPDPDIQNYQGELLFPWQYLPRGFQIGAPPSGQCKEGYQYWTYTDYRNRTAVIFNGCIKDVTIGVWNPV